MPRVSGPEVQAIRNGTGIDGKGERREFLEKLDRLKIADSLAFLEN